MQSNLWTSLLAKPFSRRQILNPFKFEKSADDIFNVGTIELQFSDTTVNIEGKRENARKQHFLLFPLGFQKSSYPGS